jgi:hypothetical protein
LPAALFSLVAPGTPPVTSASPLLPLLQLLLLPLPLKLPLANPSQSSNALPLMPLVWAASSSTDSVSHVPSLLLLLAPQSDANPTTAMLWELPASANASLTTTINARLLLLLIAAKFTLPNPLNALLSNALTAPTARVCTLLFLLALPMLTVLGMTFLLLVSTFATAGRTRQIAVIC